MAGRIKPQEITRILKLRDRGFKYEKIKEVTGRSLASISRICNSKQALQRKLEKIKPIEFVGKHEYDHFDGKIRMKVLENLHEILEGEWKRRIWISKFAKGVRRWRYMNPQSKAPVFYIKQDGIYHLPEENKGFNYRQLQHRADLVVRILKKAERKVLTDIRLKAKIV